MQGNTGRAVILVGPKEAGVSVLLKEWRKELHRQREQVFEADCLPAGPVYAPLVEVIGRYMRVVESLGLLDEPLSQLYGAVGRSLGVARLTPLDLGGTSPEKPGDQAEFFDNLGRLFSELSRKIPGVIILENLHLADSATQAAVTYLLRYVVTDPIATMAPAGLRTVSFVGLFVASVTDENDLADVLHGHLHGHEAVRFVDIRDATEESVRRFLSSPEVIRRFLDSTGGDADHLEALLEDLPRNVEDLFLRRCMQLSPEEMEVLGGIAVCGKPIEPDLLLHLLELEPSGSILNELLKKRVLVRRVHRGQLLLDLPSQGNRQLVYLRLDPEKRTRLHGRYAGILRQRARYGGPADLAELAHHYLRSDSQKEAVEYAILAAERLHMTFAYEQAIELLEAVLPRITQAKERLVVLDRLIDLFACRHEDRRALYYCGYLKRELSASQRAPLHRRIAEMLLRLGSYKGALRLIEKAHEAARLLPTEAERVDESGRIDSIRAEAYYGLAQYDRVVAVCQSGLRRRMGSPSAEAQRQALNLNNTLGKVYLLQEDYQRAIDTFRQNLQQAEEHHWPEEAVRARFNLGTVALQQRDYVQAEELLSSCLGSGGGIANPVIRAFVLMNLGVAYHKTNRFTKALEAYLDGLATFSRSGNELQYAVVAMNLGALYQVLGDLPRARALLQDSLKVIRARGIRYYEGWASYVLGSIALEQGQLDEAEKALEVALGLMREHGGATWTRRIQVRQGRLALIKGDVTACQSRLNVLEGSDSTREEKEIEAEARQCLGQAYLASGAAQAGLSELVRARQLAEEVEAQDRLSQIEVLLAEQYHREGRVDEAVRCLESATNLINKLAEDLPPTVERLFLDTPERRKAFRLLEEIRSSRNKSAKVFKQMSLPNGREYAAWRARYGRIVGEDRKLLQIFRMIDRVADSESTVLILGESGTGKELIAEAIHQNSARRDRPFVKVNCAAFVETLLLSELFGHEKGAFTGALARKKGRFELAHGGTLFLDEIGDISHNTQIALLRVLQERTFERVGGSEPTEVDVRVLVASNRNLEEMVKRGEFRLDLYYRLKGVIIELPPLRARRGDIIHLLEHFTRRFQPAGRHQLFSREALEYLARYSWPGNVRELENFSRSITLFVDDPLIELYHILQFEEFFNDGEFVDELPPDFFQGLTAPDWTMAAGRSDLDGGGEEKDDRCADPQSADLLDNDTLGSAMMSWARNEGLGLPELRKWIELEYIKRALIETGGNITQAAKLLDMKRPRLSQIINGTPELAALKDKLTSA